MSFIEEALRRVQERTDPRPKTTVNAPSSAPNPSAGPTLSISRPNGTIPPVTPSPMTVGGIGAVVLSVGVLIAVSALTVRHASLTPPHPRRMTEALVSAPDIHPPHAVIAPQPLAAEPLPAAAVQAAAVTQTLSAPNSAAPAPAAAPVPSADQFVLSGIAQGGSGEPVAIINGHILKIGDTIGDATVADILPDAARLRWPDREIVIRINR